MVSDFEEHLSAKKLSEKTIKQYLKHMRLFEKECKRINQPSINRFVSKHQSYVTRAFLKNLFEFFGEQGIDERTLPKIPIVRGIENKLKKDPVSIKDLKKIRQYLLDYRDYKYVLMFDLSYHCGLRREEVTSIKKDNFYWNEWQEGKGMRLKVKAKGSERIVIIPSALAKRVVKYFIKRVKKISQLNRFFGVKVSRWHQVFKKAVNESKIKQNITLHDLRRKRATIWLDQGIDIDEVRRRLGHKNISTTQKYLIRDEEERLKRWENAI